MVTCDCSLEVSHFALGEFKSWESHAVLLQLLWMFIDTARIVCGAESCNGRASVRRLSVPSFDSRCGMRRVCCWAPRGRRYRSTAAGGKRPVTRRTAARRLAADAGSVMFTAELTRLNTDLLIPWRRAPLFDFTNVLNTTVNTRSHDPRLQTTPASRASCCNPTVCYFYRAMLCIRGTSHAWACVCLSVRVRVCHKSEFY